MLLERLSNKLELAPWIFFIPVHSTRVLSISTVMLAYIRRLIDRHDFFSLFCEVTLIDKYSVDTGSKGV